MHSPIHPFINPPFLPSIHQSTSHPFIHPFIQLPIHQSIHASIQTSTHYPSILPPSTYSPNYPLIYQSKHLFIHPVTHLINNYLTSIDSGPSLMLGDIRDRGVTKTTSDLNFLELTVQFQRQTYYQSVTTLGGWGWAGETQGTVGFHRGHPTWCTREGFQEEGMTEQGFSG